VSVVFFLCFGTAGGSGLHSRRSRAEAARRLALEIGDRWVGGRLGSVVEAGASQIGGH